MNNNPSPTEFPFGSGGYLDFANPDLSVMTIEDLAYALAGESRFRSQTISRATGRRVRYSVAEHCVRGSLQCDHELAYPFLMHEIGEGPCGDMIAPLKPLCPDYCAMEKKIDRLGRIRFKVPEVDPARVKEIDRRMLATEQRDLCPYAVGDDWHYTRGATPYDSFQILEPWSFDDAALRFLIRFADLAPPGLA